MEWNFFYVGINREKLLTNYSSKLKHLKKLNVLLNNMSESFEKSLETRCTR